MQAPSASRDNRLDFFRGCAVLLVVCMHAAALTPGFDATGPAAALFAKGQVGVQLFFVLSGALIWRSWERLRDAPHPLLQFHVKRAAKIVPLYWLFLLVNMALWALFDELAHNPHPFSNFDDPENLTVSNTVLHLLFLQELTPHNLNTLVDGSWSIVCEVYFYALFPLLRRVCTDARSALLGFAASMLVSMASAVLIAHSPLKESGFVYYNFLVQLPAFMLGIVVGIELNASPVRPLGSRGPALAAVALVVMAGMSRGNVSPLGQHLLYSMAMAFVILGAWDVLRAHGGSWLYRGVALCGRQSYAIFFVHLAVLKVLGYFEQFAGPGRSVPELLCLNLVFGTAASIALSSWIFHPIDSYFVRLGASRLRSLSANRSTVTSGIAQW